MQLQIFHGDNQVVLLQKVREVSSTFPPDAVTRFSLKKESLDQILISLSTPTFFSNKRLAIIEDCDEKKIFIEKLSGDDDLTVILLFNKELSSSSNLLKDAEKRKSRIVAISQPQDKQIFTFLDILSDRSGKAFSFFEKLYEMYGGTYLITMIIFQLRRLILPAHLAPAFLSKKIEGQQKRFTDDELIMLYRETLFTEYQIKIGKAEDQTALLRLIAKIVG